MNMRVTRLALLCALTTPLLASDPMDMKEEGAQEKPTPQLTQDAQAEGLAQRLLDDLFANGGAKEILVVSREGSTVVPNPNLQHGKWMHPKERPPLPPQK
ncbi:MAG: hypothetical protein C0514_04485 [Candidatus Puniceispirillum sp.]|nr:hypothetical protein [Candidatus Puniceispirillum sp.]